MRKELTFVTKFVLQKRAGKAITQGRSNVTRKLRRLRNNLRSAFHRMQKKKSLVKVI